jgi:chemotaxis protein methyltransferase CheR
LRPVYRSPVVFQRGDVEAMAYAPPYHLVCCRNLVFTYFNMERQVLFLSKLQPQMTAGGVLEAVWKFPRQARRFNIRRVMAI